MFHFCRPDRVGDYRQRKRFFRPSIGLGRSYHMMVRAHASHAAVRIARYDGVVAHVMERGTTGNHPAGANYLGGRESEFRAPIDD